MSNRRDSYADVGQAARRSWDTAVAAGATPAELVVLAAIHYFLTTYSRLSDRRTLSHIARKAGLWPDETDPPKWVLRRVSERIKTLVEYGAIEWQRGGIGGPGMPGRFTMPSLTDPAVSAGPSDDAGPAKSGALAQQNPARWPSNSRSSGPAVSAGHTRKVTRTKSEEACPSTSAPPVVGPAALRLTPPAPPSDLQEDGEGNDGGGHNERHLELVTPPRRLADVDPETYGFEHHPSVRIEHVILGYSNLDGQGYSLDLPDDDDEIDFTPQRQARIMEAITVGDHLGQHLPTAILEEILAELIAHPPERPRLALRIAREIADTWDIDLPRLTFDGAA